MINQPNQDSAPVAPEQTGLPIPPVSSPSEGQPSSRQVDEDALAEAVVSRVLPKLEAIAEKQWQSGKDKRFPEMQRGLDEVRSEVQRVLKYSQMHGGDEDKIVREMEIDDIREARRQPRPVSQPDLGGSETGNLQVDALALMVEAGITDPTEQREVAQRWTENAGGRTYRSNYDALRSLVPVLTSHSVNKSKRSATPSPAAAITPAGGPVSEPSQSELTAEYKQKMLANRGKRTVLAQLRAEYAKKGVDVHNIDFS